MSWLISTRVETSHGCIQSRNRIGWSRPRRSNDKWNTTGLITYFAGGVTTFSFFLGVDATTDLTREGVSDSVSVSDRSSLSLRVVGALRLEVDREADGVRDGVVFLVETDGVEVFLAGTAAGD